MRKFTNFVFVAGLAFAANAASGKEFDIPGGSLGSALNAYGKETGVQLIYSGDAIKGVHTKGVKGDLSADDALSRLLSGTGFISRRESGGIVVRRDLSALQQDQASGIDVAAATAASASGASLETVTVTSSKIGGDVQNIPISITALSQEQLTQTQTTGGPDLVKQVPNLTFTKTNFSGYSIQIRGIGTQAISVTTDPAVAVALNDIPFLRNHFFEQEFYDLSQAEVLRGPQGTLYGRNATAGVVNLVTAKPSDQFEAMASSDFGNYNNRRFEGMLNVPIVDDRLDLRVAGEWTKRNGYTTNEITGDQTDGRDLWSGRATLAWNPTSDLKTTLLWEHFSEDDDRLRTSKQLCKTDPIPAEVGGVPVETPTAPLAYAAAVYLSQGCSPVGLYDKGDPAHGDYGAFGVPNGLTLPFYEPLGFNGAPVMSIGGPFDPYASTSQSTNLRVIESTINPQYKAKNDTLELNVDYSVAPDMTLTSQTGYNHDFLWSTEDYNRFNTRPGAFIADGLFGTTSPTNPNNGVCTQISGNCTALNLPCTSAARGLACEPYGTFCDPQLGCSDRLVAQDLNDEKSWQLSQEFRLASNFSGPFNFSVGGNYLHYETEENYYVFFNSLTLASYTDDGSEYLSGVPPWVPGVSDNSYCLKGFAPPDPNTPSKLVGEGAFQCFYIDPNPITSLNNEGHNYFLSQNPYTLNSYAGFGEAYYNVTQDLKLTSGLRWTDDQKHFVDIPSQLLTGGYGYPVTGIVNQKWSELTGRFAANWTPKLDFTDQTLIYASYSRGYKAGGANPPGAQLLMFGTLGISTPIHPLTFKPEFINAYELGTKNTLLDGALTFNGNVFYYDYKGYQISRIVDRTAINDNFDAKVKGAEVEATYEPLPGLKFKFAGGYEDTRIDNGQSSIDLMDRADVAEHPDWMVVKPFVSQASNCILPVYVVAALIQTSSQVGSTGSGTYGMAGACSNAYQSNEDPVTDLQYKQDPTITGNTVAGFIPSGYQGFDPSTAPNNGEGWAKNLGGNELPNAPPFTASLSGDYTMPLTTDWAGTFHVDYYWQDYSWARVFNDNPYDRLRGYTNVNLALIFTSQNGWQVMGYVKNIFDVTDITGTFLNSDDSGLTTNVFLTDPRLFGVRVTKNW